MGVFTIQLEQCEFFAHHGIHPEEKANGNIFWVDVALHIDASYFEDQASLENTIDYQIIYDIVNKHMNKATELLEQLAVLIAEEIGTISSKVESIEIAISKSNPPVAGKCHRSTVSYHKVY